MEQLLTVEEAAQIARCHTETIRRGYWSGQLKKLQFGIRQVRIRLSDLEEWLQRGAKTQM
jgi:excisionase family DNA binding protein